MLPEEFRVYAILVDWATHHWTIDAYVLDEDNNVLFTFEGNSATSEVSSLSHHCAQVFISCWLLRTINGPPSGT